MYIFGGLYTLAALVITVSFLANVSVEDHNEFLIAAAYTAAKMLVIMPLFLSSVLAAVTYVGVWNPNLIEMARINLKVPRQENFTKECSLTALEDALAAHERSRRSPQCDLASGGNSSECATRICSRETPSEDATIDDVAHEYFSMEINLSEINLSEEPTNRQQNEYREPVIFRTSVSGVDNAWLTMHVNEHVVMV